MTSQRNGVLFSIATYILYTNQGETFPSSYVLKKKKKKREEIEENKFTENTKKICLVVFIVVKRYAERAERVEPSNFTICEITRRIKI